jgi:hypothetical protein
MPLTPEEQRKLDEEARILEVQADARKGPPSRHLNVSAFEDDKKKWASQAKFLGKAKTHAHNEAQEIQRALSEQVILLTTTLKDVRAKLDNKEDIQAIDEVIEKIQTEHKVLQYPNNTTLQEKQKIINQVIKKIDESINSALENKGVREHKNPIIKAWNNFKSFINEKLGTNYNMSTTGRQEKLNDEQSAMKDKLHTIRDKYEEKKQEAINPEKTDEPARRRPRTP